jgi:hypothetical protein
MPAMVGRLRVRAELNPRAALRRGSQPDSRRQRRFQDRGGSRPGTPNRGNGGRTPVNSTLRAGRYGALAGHRGSRGVFQGSPVNVRARIHRESRAGTIPAMPQRMSRSSRQAGVRGTLAREIHGQRIATAPRTTRRSPSRVAELTRPGTRCRTAPSRLWPNLGWSGAAARGTPRRRRCEMKG